MAAITLQLFDSRQQQAVEGVTSFVGVDASGSFGILPGHQRFMTVLLFGLARFRCGDTAPWRYLAMPGAVLDYADNRLSLVTRHFLIDEDYEQISRRLSEELLEEEAQLIEVRDSLRRMEEAMLRGMLRLGEEGVHLHE